MTTITTLDPHRAPMRFAFYGRTARAQTTDQLNGHLAGQYLACVRALPVGGVLTAIFYDLGPTNWLHPDPPGHILVEDAVLRRDGGISALLTEARHERKRRFDYLVVAGIDRLYRNRQHCQALLQHLHRCGIPTLFADHPHTMQAASRLEQLSWLAPPGPEDHRR
jgi:hypothetical protein